MFNVKTLLLFITASTLIFSCKKDDTNGGGTPNCRVTKVNYFETSTTPYDSAVYTYTGDKVSKVQLSSANYTLEYTGNNITKRNFFTSAGASPDLYDAITYNGDNTISKIETFYRVSGSNYALFWSTEFGYTGGKLTKVTNYEVTNNVRTGFDEYTYTYTGNNITTAAYSDLTDPGSPAQNINFAYDNNPNYLKRQNSQVFLLDAFFIDPELYLFLPMIFSQNNVTTITGDAGFVNVSYDLDNNQNLVNYRIMQGNTQVLRSQYTYTCN
jgi:hypothetical protein